MFTEDVDLDFRAQLKGLKCLYVPEAICYHIGGASAGGRQNPLTVRYVAKNSINNIVKNMPREILFSNFFKILHDFLFQQIVQILKYNKNGIYFLLGILHAFWQMPAMLRKRNIIQQDIKINTGQLDKFFREANKEIKLCRQRKKSICKDHKKGIFKKV